ncbi:glycosyltransferase family 2 protein [Pseudokineococcus lusitanus]|uniref:Glycosyltransferase involved in cell wall biosynthesis n=1 Tax=Pseudokineococcus lusitanus TaxID=763993 RepID=A0A3N1G949_9ACTN|nr:glycosyltransferase [Pseudokineococcus lusitanus]ROP26747.1 glycosyltransferase involved in cell wall biosynthesis [Pseudokineococcus lusitanus]
MSTPRPGRRYLVVSPCKDEADLLPVTAASMLAQTERPALWLVVDDGSDDRTPDLLRHLASQHSWVRVLTRPAGTPRRLGSGVVEAFDAGLASVGPLTDFDYVCKLDLDLRLPTSYFAGLMDLLEADHALASVSGRPWFRRPDGTVAWERCGGENCVGMAKFYRREAYEDIGGFVPRLMWDGIDCHESRRRGWRSAAVPDDALAFEHLRPMGSSDRGVLRGRRRHGHGQYLMGSSPLFVLASAARRLADPPALLGSLNMLAGWAWAAVTRVERHGDQAFRSSLRRYQHESLVLGKHRATERTRQRAMAGRGGPA